MADEGGAVEPVEPEACEAQVAEHAATGRDMDEDGEDSDSNASTLQLPGLGGSEPDAPADNGETAPDAPADNVKLALVQDLDAEESESDAEMPPLVSADPDVLDVCANTPPKSTYNEELFQSPQAGNSGFSSEVMEMCIALMQWLANHEPSILKMLA